MALPPEIEAELDAAYEGLNAMVEALLDRGHHPRALVGGMGRLFVQMMNEHLSADERSEMGEAMAKALTPRH